MGQAGVLDGRWRIAPALLKEILEPIQITRSIPKGSPMPHNDPVIWIGSYYAVQSLCFAKHTNRSAFAGNRGRVDEL